MFRHEPVQYSDENPVLGCYLGLSIDSGLEITVNILKVNVEVFHSSMY